MMLRSPPSSAMACSAMSLGSALPCQPFLFSISGKPLPLIVLAMISVGWSVCASASAVGVVDLAQVVAVDLDGVPAERPGAGGVGVAVPAEHRLAALAQAVHIEMPIRLSSL